MHPSSGDARSRLTIGGGSARSRRTDAGRRWPGRADRPPVQVSPLTGHLDAVLLDDRPTQQCPGPSAITAITIRATWRGRRRGDLGRQVAGAHTGGCECRPPCCLPTFRDHQWLVRCPRPPPGSRNFGTPAGPAAGCWPPWCWAPASRQSTPPWWGSHFRRSGRDFHVQVATLQWVVDRLHPFPGRLCSCSAGRWATATDGAGSS